MSEKIQPTAYPLRMPLALREMLEESARKTKRSLNAEITDRLEESFESPHLKRMGLGELADVLIEMGRENGLSVEVTFSQNADHASDSDASAPSLMPMTTSIKKDALLRSIDEPLISNLSEQTGQEMSDAIRRAFMALEEVDRMVALSATPKGPKPRKRYTKK
ncbi:Arc family DNA-binding protein [Pseudomonas maioricensis]|nr:Arc family DNA-binding protein [Pseudomonas sp. S25]